MAAIKYEDTTIWQKGTPEVLWSAFRIPADKIINTISDFIVTHCHSPAS